MRIIHCADLHLDSRMSAHLDTSKAKERKAEMLRTFADMVKYAADRNAAAIIIAGDMFDTRVVSQNTKNTIMSIINNNPNITFFYLAGNHDDDNFISSLTEKPNNLILFTEEQPSFAAGDIVVTGIEPPYYSDVYTKLNLDESKFNIVIMHGQESKSSAGRNPEIVNLSALKGKGIDYLALGHIHSFKSEKLDERGTYCYPGCLEGRGFDECGPKGFVLLDIDPSTHKFTNEFVAFAKRRIYEISVDISDCNSTYGVGQAAEKALAEEGIPFDALIKVVFTGEVDVEAEIDLSVVEHNLNTEYYYVKLEDKTKLKIDPANFMHDESMKGEFVRLVMESDEISDDDRAAIIRYGIRAISGEEIV